ncbi:MAG: phosphoribosylformylglycinamidine cyclo-ligase [Thermoanaerobaculia bacterium]|nr:phosphoribosylformylglycinamidine cyclo-ligase [Thermoanaerobaculia bacterium]
MTRDAEKGSAYAAAGVDIDAQERALDEIKRLARGTFTPGVLSEVGSFGGLFRPDLAGVEDPVLVASADGVGTKLMVARRVGDFSTVGVDLVNHCVNDVLVQGARPLFFLDYLGAGELEPEAATELVAGVARACRDNGCALLGGEMAEMPGLYPRGEYELVGFVVGLVDRAAILDGSKVRPRDVLVGLPSSGLHTNGYSLARKVFFDRLGLSADDPIPGSTSREGVGRRLLEPHLSYLEPLAPLLGHPGLHALAHVTGGGLTDNLPRVLPSGCHAQVRLGTWEIPEIFRLLESHGGVGAAEMLRVFNMGVGMVAVVDPAALAEVLGKLESAGHRAAPIGTVQEGGSGVVYELAQGAVDRGDGPGW